MEVVPNKFVDGRHMLEALGEAMDEAEQDKATRAQEDGEDDPLSKEIGRLIEEKGWSEEERRKYLDELMEGPELPMFAESTEDMDPRLVEALTHLKYDGETPEDLALFTYSMKHRQTF